MYTQETRIYYALLAGLIVLLILTVFFILTIAGYQRKKIKYERGLMRQQFKALEGEKERIAADLHDDLGALLAAIKMRIQATPEVSNAARQHLSLTESQIDHSLNKIRNISRNMMPSSLKRKGLKTACLELLGYIGEHSSIKIQISAEEINVPVETQVQMYRMTQEILKNIVSHSKAAHIEFDLCQQGCEAQLFISDDGIGFNQKKVLQESTGAGLRNIMARAEIINAKVYLTTAPGKGVAYTIKTTAYENPKNKSADSR